MNTENIKRAIAVVQRLPYNKLGMDAWRCGTVFCLAGALADSEDIPEITWGKAADLPTIIKNNKVLRGSEAVREFFEIEERVASELCAVDVGWRYKMTFPHIARVRDITKKEVLIFLYRLLKTGMLKAS